MIVNVFMAWVGLWCIRTIAANTAWGKQIMDYIEGSGFTCSLFHVAYETNRFNTLMFKWFNEPNRKRRLYLGTWFNCGVFVMAVGQICSTVVLTFMLLNSLSNLLTYDSGEGSNSQNASQQSAVPAIAPIIPGINFPAKYLLDFWICTFVVIVVHEFGHAAAASMERLQIQGCGTFFLFMFPGAYVRVEESIQYLPMYPQLRVYSAGVWHNIVMAGMCVLFLFGLPHALSLGYIDLRSESDGFRGAVVTQVHSLSPLTASLRVGDVITHINGEPFASSVDYQSALNSLQRNIDNSLVSATTLEIIQKKYFPYWQVDIDDRSIPMHTVKALKGICISHMRVEALMDSSLQCCRDVVLPPSLNSAQSDTTNSCFMHQRTHRRAYRRGNATLDTDIATLAGGMTVTLYCLPARNVITSSIEGSDVYPLPCDSDVECTAGDMCTHALTPYPTSIITLTVARKGGVLKEVLFQGAAEELLSWVGVGDYSLGLWLSKLAPDNSIIFSLLMRLPEKLTLYAWLGIQLNLSVAFVNMLPVQVLDGGLACPQFARLLFPSRNWSSVATAIQYYGLFLLASNAAVGVLPYIQYLWVQ